MIGRVSVFGIAGIVVLSVGARLCLGNSAPVVSNVTPSQRNDGSKKVDIRYSLADADGDAYAVSVVISNDAGSTWTVPATALTGAVGSDVTPGVGKLIVWDCKIDLPGAFGSQYKVRVRADDVHGPQPPPGMSLIPAGEFQMGDTFNEGHTSEQPVHAVHVDSFYIDRTEATNQQYADALNWAKNQGDLITVTDGIVYKYNTGMNYLYCYTATSSSESRITWNGTTFGVASGKENHPVGMVTWYGSVAYANWRSAMQGRPPCYDLSTWTCNFSSGYRLPTEAEWEKAARGGAVGHRFPWSDTDTIQHARANYNSYWEGGHPYHSYDTSSTEGFHPLWGGGSSPYTSPVGFFNGSLRYKADFGWPGTPASYQTSDGANGYGLYDMAGNVWEWCNDWYSPTYYSTTPYPHDNPRGPTSGFRRILRGGGWTFGADYCRVADRSYSSPPDYRFGSIGFRLALDAGPFARADFNKDGFVDQLDYDQFAGCATGPAIPYDPWSPAPTCTLGSDALGLIPADLDFDGDVDQSDFGIFQQCFSGESIQADPNCAN